MIPALQAARVEPGGRLLFPLAPLARVFDRFYRLDPSRQRATGGGSGLGLAIVKHLTEAQRGRVSASSNTSGTVFTIELRST